MDYGHVDTLLRDLTELVGSGVVGPYMVPIGSVQRAWPDDESGADLNKDPKPPYADQYFSAPDSMIKTMNEPKKPNRILVLLSSVSRSKSKKK